MSWREASASTQAIILDAAQAAFFISGDRSGLSRRSLQRERLDLKLGICGMGTVASGVINVLRRNRSAIHERSGVQLDIVHVGARRDNPNCDISSLTVSRDVFAVARDPEVECVVELIGGTTTAHQLVLESIQNGKHVVTANKALIATHGDELFAAAAENNVALRFEAAVAGGIPVIKALQQGLAANRIDAIAGIINGTGNYILTEMKEHGRSFEEALADAQALGYAEADPTFDVEGIDAAQKLVVLAALAYGISFDGDACFTEGISRIKVDDIRHAETMGYAIKHLGVAKKVDAGLELRVHPALVPHSELIASVRGVMNAVAIHGDAVGPTLHYGPGAGSEPTASAVLADVIDLAADVARGQERFDPQQFKTDISIVAMQQVETPWYLRIPVVDKPGVLSEVSKALSSAGISIQSMHQPDAEAGQAQLILLTNRVAQAELEAALETIESLTIVEGEIVSIRVETLGKQD